MRPRAAQQSRLSRGDRQQKGSCCFGFTSPGLWLGIAWHKRRSSRLSLWRPQKLSQMFVRSGEIPSPGQTSSDKNNDCAMKSQRGTPVRGSDPPSGIVYNYPSFLKTAQACLYTHVAAPGSIKSKRIAAKPAREGFVSMCTEYVCVYRARQDWHWCRVR